MRMALRGHLAVSVIFDEEGRLAGGAWAEPIGLPDSRRFPDGLAGAVEQAIDQALGRAKKAELGNDDAVERLVVQASNRVCLDLVGKKPIVTVMISRLD
jgi:ribonuclease J